MIIAIRGLGGAVGSTLVLGMDLGRAGLLPCLTAGMVIEQPSWAGLPVVKLDQVGFGGWDVRGSTIGERALEVGIFTRHEISRASAQAAETRPRRAPTRPKDVAANVVKADQSLTLSAVDTLKFYCDELREMSSCDESIVCVNLASTEKFNGEILGIENYKDLLRLVREDSPLITSGVALAMACIETGVPFCDFTADATLECPAIQRRAAEACVPVAGKDGNTGQTFLKLILAEAFRERQLQVLGWYSANILGNLDGRVLDLPDHLPGKRADKLNAMENLLSYPFDHDVDIAFVPAWGDFKESWDSVILQGWLGRFVELRVNWRASDSILASPLILDLCRMLDLSRQRRHGGVQSQLSVYFKRPISGRGRSFWKEFEVLQNFYKAE